MVREIKTINLNNLIIRDFNYTMNKLDRDAGKKTQRLYRCGSNFPVKLDRGELARRSIKKGEPRLL